MADDRRTRAAFDAFRATHGPARPPLFWRHPTDLDQMTSDDGMDKIVDGTGPDPAAAATLARMSEDELPAAPRVWAIRADDVVHAPCRCAFGSARAATEVKHTNLTGGGQAYGGGELMILPNGALIVNGRSGRYGIRDAAEMADVALAFKDSGYTVYSMGSDEGTNTPYPFVGGPAPTLI